MRNIECGCICVNFPEATTCDCHALSDFTVAQCSNHLSWKILKDKSEGERIGKKIDWSPSNNNKFSSNSLLHSHKFSDSNLNVLDGKGKTEKVGASGAQRRQKKKNFIIIFMGISQAQAISISSISPTIWHVKKITW